jgi:hypothetical protein
MTYQYKGRGMVQITGNKQMNTQPIPSISISSTNTSTWPHSSGFGGVALGGSSSFGNIGIQSLDDLLGHTHYKKQEIYEFEDDILAISCAWKRQRDDAPAEYRYSKMTDRKLFDSVTTDDRESARLVRDYYSKKVMMLTLKGQPLTRFRKDLNTYIHGDTNCATEELFPLIYKLPDFYEYDIKIDEIKTSLEDRLKGVKLEKMHGKQSSFDLTPITSVKKHNKRINTIEYWFSGKSNTPVLIQLEPKNPLLHIWNNMFSSKKVLQISGMSFVKSMDDFEYLSIKNWTLAKI